MKTLSIFLLLASVSLADSLVLVTTDNCKPCEAAKKLLADTNLQGLELKEMPLAEGRKTFVGPINAPTLVLLDSEGKFKQSITTINPTHVTYLLSLAEVEALQSLKLPDFLGEPQPLQDAGPFGAPPRRIPYVIATQYRSGIYQGTFTWGQIDHAFGLLERYWNIDCVRVNSGATLRIIQANTNGPVANAAAWTRGNDIYISPTYNFSNIAALCEMVVMHEFGHTGGSNHDSAPATLMHANGGYVITQSTYRWFARFQWKSGLRPHQEPNFMSEYLGRAVRGTPDDDKDSPLLKCGH